MASSVVSPMASRLPAAKAFRIGQKQVFLPAHKIAFIAPRENDPPNFATFQVPLSFNKLDLRDYLLHVYGTSVISVRSAIKQHRIVQDEFYKTYKRPQSTKYMTAVLKEPFVWPSAPEDITPWKSKASEKRAENEKIFDRRREKMVGKGEIDLISQIPPSESDKMLRAEAERLSKEGGWSNKLELDPKFDDLEQKLEKKRLK
ncbi:hypothetical protein F5Y16DRAFT_372894 [Xylariaceae sp. FL0255]|nr:hypothetical protein F5Y16DRAFT_372894 [Xylariaceae sp. FL0255]